MHNDAREHRLEIDRLSLGGRGGVVEGLPGVDPGIKVEVLQRGGQIGVIGGVVGLHRIARGHIVPMVGGDFRFHAKEVAGHIKRGFAGNRGGSVALVIAGVGRQFIATVGLGGGCVSGVHQLGGDHRHVRFAHGSVVILAIVGFIRQTKAGLLKVGDIAVRVAGIAVNGQAEQVGAAGWVDGAEHARESGLVDGGIDEVKLVADRVKTGGLDGVGVQERMVQSLRLGGRAVVGVEDVAHLVFGVFGELVKGAVARTIVGQSVGVDPWAIHVAEQVVGRLDDGGERCRVDARRQRFGFVGHGPKPNRGGGEALVMQILRYGHCAISELDGLPNCGDGSN